MNSNLYDRLKFLAQIGLPALGSLYFGLAGIWGLPSAESVVGTIVIFDTFLGTILQISSSQYKSETNHDGVMIVDKTQEGKTVFSLELNVDPETLENAKQVIFKVHQSENDA